MSADQDKTLPDPEELSEEQGFLSTIAARVDIVEGFQDEERLTEEHPGRYEILGELGEGGIGRVYLALDKHLGRRVALKELLEEVTQAARQTPDTAPSGRSATELRFVNEARITGQLEHPGIVPVYELGRRDDRTVYYAMRYVKGRTLEDALNVGDLRARLGLLTHFVDLCNTVAYAHSRGVIHRDLKPENVMLGDFGETVILDWGLAKVRGEDDMEPSALDKELERVVESSVIKTMAGVPLGTPGYMSPEQALGQLSVVDEQSDVYSLGVILYQLITGTLPFEGKSARQVIERLVNEEPIAPEQIEPECSPEIAAIAMRAMAKQREDRYADARAMAADIRAFLTGGLVRAHRYSVASHLLRFVTQQKRKLGVALAIVMVASIAWWYRGVDEERRLNEAEQEQRDDAAAAVDAIIADVARGNLQERWLDVFTVKVMVLRNPVTEDTIVDRLVVALAHGTTDVRRLAARSLSAVKSDTALNALVERLRENVEPSTDVIIEVVNALAIISDARAEDAVREARVRAGQYSQIWNQTELAYRMIPMPELIDGGSGLQARDWNERGNALLWKGRQREALDAFSRAIAQDPTNPTPYNNRAIVLRSLGELGQALADYDMVLEIAPNDVLALNNRSLLKRQMEDYEGALEDIDLVVAEGSLGVKALRNRSIIKRFIGDHEGAIGDLQLALADKPDDERTYSAIAGTWVWNGGWEEALSALDQAIAVNEKYTYAVSQRAMVFVVLGQNDKALIDLEHVLSLEPADNDARRLRAFIYMKTGQHQAAKRDLDYCLENQCTRGDESDRATRLAQRAIVYYAGLAAYSRALMDLDSALAADPQSADAFEYRLAALAVAVRAKAAEASDEVGSRTDALLSAHLEGPLWPNRATRVLAGQQDYDALLGSTLRPLERCAISLAGGIAMERAGDRQKALERYRHAADVGNPNDLACILADQAVAALDK